MPQEVGGTQVLMGTWLTAQGWVSLHFSVLASIFLSFGSLLALCSWVTPGGSGGLYGVRVGAWRKSDPISLIGILIFTAVADQGP